MKILVLTSSFPTKEGGPHSPEFVANLVKNLPLQQITPVVLAPHFPQGPIREKWNNIAVNRFPYFFPFRFERLAYGAGLLFNVRRDFFAFAGLMPFFLSEMVWTIVLLYREHADIIHTHWLVPQGLIGAVCFRVFKKPHVLTIHGSDLNLMKGSRLLQSLCRFIVRNSSIVTVNSTYMKSELEKIVPKTTDKIRIIPMGVDPVKFKRGVSPDADKKSSPDRIILSVGRLIDWKGTIYLVRAMPRVLEKIPNTKLIVIGTGPEETALKQAAKDLSIEGSVIFTGRIANNELLQYYQTADTFVLPSINKSGNTEALGVVLLEAMAAGCPVIGSNVGGIPDIIKDGESGFLVPEKDPTAIAEKIIIMFSDDTLAERFRSKAFNTVLMRFSWEQIALSFSELYKDIIANRSGNKSRIVQCT